MKSLRFHQVPSFLFLSLFVIPSDAFRQLTSLPIDDKTLNELITPMIVSAVLRELRNSATGDQVDSEPSPQHEQPFFAPLSLLNRARMPHQPYLPQMLPLMHPLPLPFHHRVHPHLHPRPHVHHARPQPVAIIPHGMVPLFHEQLLAHIIRQLQQPIIDQQPLPRMQAIEIIENVPMPWIPPPHVPGVNPMFHRPMHFGALLNHEMH